MRTTSISLVLAASLSNALVNITVDDADTTSISFTSHNCLTLQPDEAGTSWQVSPGKFVHACHNQTLRRCDEAGASVSFKFMGINICFKYGLRGSFIPRSRCLLDISSMAARNGHYCDIGFGRSHFSDPSCSIRGGSAPSGNSCLCTCLGSFWTP